MTNIKYQISNIKSQLQASYPADEAEALAWWIAEEMTGLSRSQLISGCKDTTFFSNLQEIIARLLHFEPIQYIFGHTLWCGLDLKVTPATLIPRPETAELVNLVAGHPSTKRQLKILDIGTGTGCIAIALKKRHPEWQITAIDISAEAIKVAKENAKQNHTDITFMEMDIFSDEIGKNSPFDIIVSNPPYICEKEKISMSPNVLLFEPHYALFVPDADPLRFYRRIASLHLAECLFFEINEAYPSELAAMLDELAYSDIQTIRDIYGKPRIIQARSTR